MVDKIKINVYTLSGISKQYDINVNCTVNDFIKEIIYTHDAYINPLKFDTDSVDFDNTRLIYNSKTLDHYRTFDDYTEFQIKSSRIIHKMFIIPKGGGIVNPSPTLLPLTPSPSHSLNDQLFCQNAPSSPISIKQSGKSPIVTGSFLGNQINRIDRSDRQDRKASSSFSDISEQLIESLKLDNTDKLDKIYELLLNIDTKLNKLSRHLG
jgi:hypothetical protein